MSVVMSTPQDWDAEADVVIVGYGGAGAVSAISAADAGARVVVLEKNPAQQHFCRRDFSSARRTSREHFNTSGRVSDRSGALRSIRFTYSLSQVRSRSTPTAYRGVLMPWSPTGDACSAALKVAPSLAVGAK
jgi:glycine/D-amino acid oxidase-like deaminating enzyme